MWESNETVFNVIKPPLEKRRRTPPRTPDDAPKAMTVRNLLWKMKNNLNMREAGTFGYPPGSATPRPSKFLRKHSKEPKLTDPHRRIRIGGGSVSDRCMSKKAPLPDLERNPSVSSCASERETTVHDGSTTGKESLTRKKFLRMQKYGLKRDIDYITANAVMVIRAKPDKSHCPEKEKPPMMEPSFGRLPMYLAKRKNEASKKALKDSPENQGKCPHPGTRRLEGDEKRTIINGLKIKWAVLNAEYQRLPFVTHTDAQKIRKNRYEQELENLQRDVSLLSRKLVLVSDKGPSKVKPPLL